MATGNAREERSGQKNAAERSYQRRNYEKGERGGYQRNDGKPYNKLKDGGRTYRPKFDKDKDEDTYKRGNNRAGEHRSVKSQAAKDVAKIKEQQPDKMDIVKRLEKEKKAMQKKNNNQNSGKNKANAGRVQRPVKRSNNIDWTKQYENDSYDDDEMSYIY